jgi:hypothetical protein
LCRKQMAILSVMYGVLAMTPTTFAFAGKDYSDD